jgi:hypothetical protein
MIMKQLLYTCLLCLLVGCSTTRELVIPQTGNTPGTPATPGTPPELQVRTVSGEWIATNGGAGGINSFDTFKNFQYTLEVTKNNQKFDITLTSADIDVQYALFDPLGQRINVSNLSRSPVGTYTVNAGTYRVVVCAARQAVGKFVLTVVGTNSDPILIPSQILQSGTQNWGPLGGGGPLKSTKNPTYTFDVTDNNTIIDLEIESADTDPALVLYDKLDTPVAFQAKARYLFQLQAAQKGTYTVIAGTTNYGDVGNFRLRIFGKVANLTQVQSVSATASGSWASGTAFDTYSFEIGANSSPITVDLTSPDIDVRINLLNSVGSILSTTCCPSKSTNINIENLSKGIYQIMVQSYPSSTRRGPGNYAMNVFGRFTNFKKL